MGRRKRSMRRMTDTITMYVAGDSHPLTFKKKQILPVVVAGAFVNPSESRTQSALASSTSIHTRYDKVLGDTLDLYDGGLFSRTGFLVFSAQFNASTQPREQPRERIGEIDPDRINMLCATDAQIVDVALAHMVSANESMRRDLSRLFIAIGAVIIGCALMVICAIVESVEYFEQKQPKKDKRIRVVRKGKDLLGDTLDLYDGGLFSRRGQIVFSRKFQKREIVADIVSLMDAEDVSDELLGDCTDLGSSGIFDHEETDEFEFEEDDASEIDSILFHDDEDEPEEMNARVEPAQAPALRRRRKKRHKRSSTFGIEDQSLVRASVIGGMALVFAAKVWGGPSRARSTFF